MQNPTVKLHALRYDDARTYLAAALLVAGNILLPIIFHSVHLGGQRWLPIYFFTLVGAYKYGWRVGLLTALASPLLHSALLGMPAAAALPVVLLKSLLLAGAAGFAAARYRRVTLPLLAAVVLFYQGVGTLGQGLFTGSLTAAVWDLGTGLPGMLLQVAGGWLVIRAIRR